MHLVTYSKHAGSKKVKILPPTSDSLVTILPTPQRQLLLLVSCASRVIL